MPNLLRQASSPYLRQHADNPVDWVEWSPDAFAEARRRDVPVLVSIGYATCHWCHVMAHETFEDGDVAAVMNRDYVCIKVDREELPEVDEIYMDAVQTLTGHGGWPLNAFVDHEGRPFFAGTYFPKARWREVLGALTSLWQGQRARIASTAAELSAHLLKYADVRVAEVPPDLWARAEEDAAESYDAVHPGFGGQPKFPPSQLLLWLLGREAGSARGPGHPGHPDQGEASRAERVLEAMQDAGLHDRVGGGFHRYSVDSGWRVPHFEKMLYDNALLAVGYAEGGVRFGRADFTRTAVRIGEYLVRDMRVVGPAGFMGYAAAEDADDPGGEGSFYAWPPAEIEAVAASVNDVHAASAAVLIRAWDLTPGAPERGHSGHLEPVASHIPHPRALDLGAYAAALGVADAEGLRASWEPWLPVLRARRDARPRPMRDDKVLTDWNGLALWALATLGRLTAFSAEPARELAAALAGRETANGLLRLPGRAAYVTDYGHLALGLYEAYRLTGDATLIARACRLVDEAVARLGAEGGRAGFFTTPAGRTDLFRRSREHADHAYPAGQHALALVCVRLSHLTGEGRYRAVAEGVWRSQARILERAPTACPTLLLALEAAERPAVTVVVAGAAGDARTEALLGAARRSARGEVVAVPTAGHEALGWPLFEGRCEVTEPTAFVCEGTVCRLPTRDPAAVWEAVR